ncbi:MAG: insulinase family protein [Legionellaceae bacterium]|nr:insulinase family protein [Legionellaceae bacterium]
MRQIFLLLLSLVASLACADVQEYQLENGLKVLVKPDHRAPVAIVMLWYNVGSADEVPGKTGLAHALEHMMFKGTRTYPPGYFSKTIAGVGGQENAFTSNDYTAYFEKIAASQLPLALKLEAARMRDLVIDEAEFAKEIKVVREERRLRTDDNPQGVLYERFMATAHLAPPYQHPVIGWMSDLEQMQASELKQWYVDYYAPRNAVLVVVGDVQAAEVFKLAKEHFAHLEPGRSQHRKNFPEPESLGKKTVNIEVPAKMPMMMNGYRVPSLKSAKVEWHPYALEVLAGVLSGGESARFAKEMIRKKQSASSVEAYYNPFARYDSQFIIAATPAHPEGLAQVEQDILAQISRLQNEAISPEELERVKTQLIAQKTFEKDSLFGQAMEMGLLETVGLGWRMGDHFVEQLQAIRAEQVQDVANLYLIARNLTRAELVPLSSRRKAA